MKSLDGMFASLFSETNRHVGKHEGQMDFDERQKTVLAIHLQRIVRGFVARRRCARLSEERDMNKDLDQLASLRRSLANFSIDFGGSLLLRPSVLPPLVVGDMPA